MSDETNETEKLAKVVYKKHKKVIDYIMENSASPIAEAGRRFVTDDKDNGLKMLKKLVIPSFSLFLTQYLKKHTTVMKKTGATERYVDISFLYAITKKMIYQER